jgi:hypothetical protein
MPITKVRHDSGATCTEIPAGLAPVFCFLRMDA